MTPVDRFDLELYLLGALDDPARIAAVEAAIEGELADAWSELQEARGAWQPAPLPLPTAGESPVSRPAWSGWRGLALAAAVLLALAGPLLMRSEPSVRAMGQLPVDAYAERAGATLGSLREGDVLGVRTTVPAAGVVAVGLVQPELGDAELLWVSDPVARGAEVALPAGLQLDGYSGEEWLVLTVHPSAPTEEDWAMHARGFIRDQRSSLPGRAVLLRGRR